MSSPKGLFQNVYFVHQTLYKGALKNWIRHVLYFDTLDKTGIETLLVDEDDIKETVRV